MTLIYSNQWKGGRWDVEELLGDLFTFTDNIAATLVSGLKVEPFHEQNAETEAWLAQGNGYLFVHRSGGNLNLEAAGPTDEATVTLGALTKSRHDSNELMSFVTDMLTAFRDGGTVYRSAPHRSGLSTTFMKAPGEVVGPQLIPGQIRDERLTPAMWQIHSQLPGGLPNYRELLELDTE